MKLRLSALLALAALTASPAAFAQAAPAAPGTTPPAAAPGAAPTGKSSAEKPKPLSSADKKFIKDSTEGMYLVLEALGQAKTSAATEATKKLAEKMKADLDKIWGDVGGFATANGELLPAELKGADKSSIDRLRKAEKEKWDKAFMNLAGKEMKRVSRAFEGAKTLQNAELKVIAEKHRATLTGYDAEITATEKEIKAK